MKGKAEAPPAPGGTEAGLDPTVHGLKCPVCDDGNLIKGVAANVDLYRDREGKTHRRGIKAKYVYSCDSCDHMEEVVRDGSEA